MPALLIRCRLAAVVAGGFAIAPPAEAADTPHGGRRGAPPRDQVCLRGLPRAAASFRSVTNSAAPERARPSAMLRPKSPPAPVTRATRPGSSKSAGPGSAGIRRRSAGRSSQGALDRRRDASPERQTSARASPRAAGGGDPGRRGSTEESIALGGVGIESAGTSNRNMPRSLTNRQPVSRTTEQCSYERTRQRRSITVTSIPSAASSSAALRATGTIAASAATVAWVLCVIDVGLPGEADGTAPAPWSGGIQVLKSKTITDRSRIARLEVFPGLAATAHRPSRPPNHHRPVLDVCCVNLVDPAAANVRDHEQHRHRRRHGSVGLGGSSGDRSSRPRRRRTCIRPPEQASVISSTHRQAQMACSAIGERGPGPPEYRAARGGLEYGCRCVLRLARKTTDCRGPPRLRQLTTALDRVSSAYASFHPPTGRWPPSRIAWRDAAVFDAASISAPTFGLIVSRRLYPRRAASRRAREVRE